VNCITIGIMCQRRCCK